MNLKVTPKELESFTSRAAKLWHIRTKDAQLVNFVPNEGQRMLEEIVSEEEQRSLETTGHKQVRLIVLKSRQVGISTHTAMRNLDALLTVPMTNALVLAHDGMTTDMLYGIYRRGYDTMPELIDIVDEDGKLLQPNYKIKPAEQSYSGKKLHLDYPLDSRLTVQTAGAKDNVGKGITLNRCHYCMGYDSPVLMADGTSKKASEVQIGDRLYCESGVVTEVTNVFDSGHKDTYEVRAWLSNEPLTLSGEHKVMTDQGYVKVKDLTKDHWVKQPEFKITGEINEYTYELPKYNDRNWNTSRHAIEKHTFSLDEEFGFVLGYYLAEGHCKPQHNRKQRYCSLNFAYDRDDTYIQRVEKFFNKFGVNGKTKHRKNSRTTTTDYHSTFLASAVESIVGRTENKHIPEWFMRTNEDFIRGLLVGLYSGDASKHNYLVNDKYHQFKTVFTSALPRIARPVRRLMMAMGLGVPSVCVYTGRERYGVPSKDSYHVISNGVYGQQIQMLMGIDSAGFTKEESNRSKEIDGVYYTRVKHVKPLGNELTLDIEVAHTDHNFETPIGIISNSEAANYPDFTSVFNSTNQSMPKSGEVYSIVESTANGVSGVGEAFYKLWVKSTKEWENFKKGITHTFEGYRPVFLPWYIMSEYRKPLVNGKLTDIENIDFGNDEEKRKFLETEQLLMDQYDVAIESINWYRATIKSECSYSLREAKRYYPTFPEDAFLATDNGFFDNTKLHVVKKNFETDPPVYRRGYLDEGLTFHEYEHGPLQISSLPDDRYMNRYIVSLDPSTGVEDGDYAPMKVYDRLTQSWVARWYGREDEDVLAEELMKLGYFYNEALLIPERNLATVINIIKPDGLMPYKGEVWADETRSDVQYGFQTNVQSRKMLLDGYKAWIRDNYDKLMDMIEVDEHMNFIKVAKHGMVRYEAAPGHHDDIVIANALTIWAADHWDEPLAEMNTEQTDIERFVTLRQRSRYGGANAARLGMRNRSGKKSGHIAPRTFTKLGTR